MAAEDEDVATAEEEDNDGGGTARYGSGGRKTAEAEDGSGGCKEEEMAAWRLMGKWVGRQLSLLFMAIECANACISLIARLVLTSQCTKIPIKPYLIFCNLAMIFSTSDLSQQDLLKVKSTKMDETQHKYLYVPYLCISSILGK
jgi:hypothetical protein